MALLDTAPQAPTHQDRADWRPWLALGLAALSAMSYLLVLVVPYYAAGAPDPAQLHLHEIDQQWSYPSVMGPLLVLLMFWALGLAPFACVGVAGWSVHRLWTTRSVPAGRAVVWSALLVAVACLAFFVLRGAELLIWLID